MISALARLLPAPGRLRPFVTPGTLLRRHADLVRRMRHPVLLVLVGPASRFVEQAQRGDSDQAGSAAQVSSRTGRFPVVRNVVTAVSAHVFLPSR